MYIFTVTASKMLNKFTRFYYKTTLNLVINGFYLHKYVKCIIHLFNACKLIEFNI